MTPENREKFKAGCHLLLEAVRESGPNDPEIRLEFMDVLLQIGGEQGMNKGIAGFDTAMRARRP